MQVSSLKSDQLLKISCKVTGRGTLHTWVNEVVGVGEMIRFSNYANYAEDWVVTEILEIDTHENCTAKWGRDVWFLKHIERSSYAQDSN